MKGKLRTNSFEGPWQAGCPRHFWHFCPHDDFKTFSSIVGRGDFSLHSSISAILNARYDILFCESIKTWRKLFPEKIHHRMNQGKRKIPSRRLCSRLVPTSCWNGIEGPEKVIDIPDIRSHYIGTFPFLSMWRCLLCSRRRWKINPHRLGWCFRIKPEHNRMGMAWDGLFERCYRQPKSRVFTFMICGIPLRLA